MTICAHALDAASKRLLLALASPGAYGFENKDGTKSSLAVVAARNGVSVRAGSSTPGAADALCSADLTRWDATGARRRLVLTPAGRARLARDHAQAGLDPFLAQHTPASRRAADAGPDSAMVMHDQAESPVAWLATRRGRDGKPLIDAASLEAGERLRRDLTLAQILPRVTANWNAAVASGVRGAGAMHFSETSLAARQRVDQALTAAGPDLAGILVDVCGFLKGLELIETERGWPQRSAKIVLVLALRQLCRHYGIAMQAVGPRASGGVRHWGAEDFRPSLSGAG